MVKNPPSSAGGVRYAGSIPGLGRYPGVGNGNPFQYACLENSMDSGSWKATVHGVTRIGLSTQESLAGACLLWN